MILAASPVSARVFQGAEPFLWLGLAAYGLAGQPTPDAIGWPEAVQGAALLAAAGLGRLLLLASGGGGPAGLALLWLLLVPGLRGAAAGWMPGDWLRDALPLGFLFLPLLLAGRLGPGAGPRLCWGLAALGVAFSLRDLAGWAGPLDYLALSPAVPFAAIWLVNRWLAAPGVRGLAGLLAAAPCVAALLLTLQRAALAAVLIGWAIGALCALRRRPGAAILALAPLGAACWLGSEWLALPLALLAEKTRLLGDNARLAEAQAVLAALPGLDDLLLGRGWGALIALPELPGARVSYTHGLLTAVLFKAGLAGLLALLAYGAVLAPSAWRWLRHAPADAAAVLLPLAVGLSVYTSYKYLCFGLLLVVLSERSRTLADCSGLTAHGGMR
ncbi:MAG TPA: hypothetical protein VEH84_16350 [Alphaproteobacteria bacterium]|nr:hypothetical protein [Alphaproteobacteria bacterium]